MNHVNLTLFHLKLLLSLSYISSSIFNSTLHRFITFSSISKEFLYSDCLVVDGASGSSIPDCSHACGPCIPCKLVVVTSTCSTSEACPVVYKCLCKGKFYHVPSNA
ncbi:hypothetical protein Bca4012_057614 [Brassica carinata]